jgi:putative transcriptional regulator
MTDSLVGRLLMATPSLLDPNFYRTAVLMIEHDEEGSLGVVLNRPLDIPVADYLDDWETLVVDPPVVFAGGPVQQEVALAVGRGPQSEGDISALIIGDIQLIDLDLDPAAVPFEQIRVFSGYAAWGPGQLEAELGEEAWWIVECDQEDPFTTDPQALWSTILKRQGGRLALFATLPDNPGLN